MASTPLEGNPAWSTGSGRTPALLLALLMSAIACLPAPQDEPGSTGPTYRRDIAPLFAERCVGCHREGGIALYPLDTYNDVRPAARAILALVGSRLMPPWDAATGCSHYADDDSLDDAQIGMVASWIAAGMPEGDGPAPSAGVHAPPRSPSRIDLTIALPEFRPTGLDATESRCFVVDWPLAGRSFVAGFAVTPGDENRMVHRVVAHRASPSDAAAARAREGADGRAGYSCAGGPGWPLPSLLGTWTPGIFGEDFPDGTGLRVEPGESVVVQVLYVLSYRGASVDRSTRVHFRLEEQVAREARFITWTHPGWMAEGGFRLPAYELSRVDASDDVAVLTGGVAAEVHRVGLQMHDLGRSARLAVRHSDGATSCLLQHSLWRPSWQRGHALEAPLKLQPGDLLELGCQFDNTVGPSHGLAFVPVDTFWGEGPRDEMCLATLYLTAGTSP